MYLSERDIHWKNQINFQLRILFAYKLDSWTKQYIQGGTLLKEWSFWTFFTHDLTLYKRNVRIYTVRRNAIIYFLRPVKAELLNTTNETGSLFFFICIYIIYILSSLSPLQLVITISVYIYKLFFSQKHIFSLYIFERFFPPLSLDGVRQRLVSMKTTAYPIYKYTYI